MVLSFSRRMTGNSPAPRTCLRFSVLLVPLVLGGCMGVAGMVAGPVSGPVGTIRRDEGCTGVALSIPLGIYLGLLRGIEKDIDFFTHGSYVAPGTLQVSEVFDPLAHMKDPRIYPVDEPVD
jgi:hypothetical protein